MTGGILLMELCKDLPWREKVRPVLSLSKG